MKKLVIAVAAAAAISGFALSASPASAAVSADPALAIAVAQPVKAVEQGKIQLARHWGFRRWHRWHRWGGWRGHRWGGRCFLRRIWTPYGPRFRRVCYY